MKSRPGILYVAHITCRCGAEEEAEAEIEVESRGSAYQSYDVPSLTCRMPEGWLGGYDDVLPECPACVKERFR